MQGASQSVPGILIGEDDVVLLFPERAVRVRIETVEAAAAAAAGDPEALHSLFGEYLETLVGEGSAARRLRSSRRERRLAQCDRWPEYRPCRRARRAC